MSSTTPAIGFTEWASEILQRTHQAARRLNPDAMVRLVDHAVLSIGRFQPGDTVVIVAGSPPGTVGSTNLIRVHRLGEEDHA